MPRIFFIILIFISFHSNSRDYRSVLNVSGGSKTLKTLDKSYRVQYSIGQQGPIGKINTMMVNARQGFIQPPKFIETNSILDKLLKVKISPNPFTEALDVVFSEEIKNKIIKKTFNRLKILGSGDLKTKLNIEANFISKSAKIKLDKLGCSISIKTIS